MEKKPYKIRFFLEKKTPLCTHLQYVAPGKCAKISKMRFIQKGYICIHQHVHKTKKITKEHKYSIAANLLGSPKYRQAFPSPKKNDAADHHLETRKAASSYLGLPLSVWRLKRVDFQYFKDKVAAKLIPWEGRYIAAPGRGVLVMSVMTSLVVYTATALVIPPGILSSITRLERAFFW